MCVPIALLGGPVLQRKHPHASWEQNGDCWASLVWLTSSSVRQQLSRSDMNCIEDSLLQYADCRGHPL